MNRTNGNALRLKIQYYMHENLAQEKWIFRLSSAAIGIGFILIVAGIVLAFQSALTGGQFLPSVVATLSGVIVQFIGRSFLWVYKSTTEQAAHYVGILERIYAVHMSQLLIEPIFNDDIRNKAYAEAAREVLTVGGVKRDSKGEDGSANQ